MSTMNNEPTRVKQQNQNHIVWIDVALPWCYLKLTTQKSHDDTDKAHPMKNVPELYDIRWYVKNKQIYYICLWYTLL